MITLHRIFRGYSRMILPIKASALPGPLWISFSPMILPASMLQNSHYPHSSNELCAS